jgi:hypothetical protein
MVMPPPRVGQTVRCQTVRALRAQLKARLVLEETSTPCSPKNSSCSSFLPREPSMLQQARRKSFHLFVLRFTTWFNHEEENGFGDSPRASFLWWEGWGRGEKMACQLYARLLWMFSWRSAIPSNRDWLCKWKGIESVCLERGGLESTTHTSVEADFFGRSLRQPAARSVFLCRMKLGCVRTWTDSWWSSLDYALQLGTSLSSSGEALAGACGDTNPSAALPLRLPSSSRPGSFHLLQTR